MGLPAIFRVPYGSFLLAVFLVGIFFCSPVLAGDLARLFGSMEYDRPIRGVVIPLHWIDPAWNEGRIEIAEASIHPGGPGMWKLASQPDLVLKGLTVVGTKSQTSKALRALSLKGIYQLKIEHFTYRAPETSETIQLDWVSYKEGKFKIREPTTKALIEIFGKDVIYQKE